MDFRKVDIENLTDSEKIQLQDENYVNVFGKQYGADYYDDCRKNVFGMVDYISPEPTSKVGEKLKKALSEDDVIAMRRQLPLLPIAFSQGYPIVLPDYNRFRFGQEEEYVKAVRLSIEKNAEIIKKYSITMPSKTNGRSK